MKQPSILQQFQKKLQSIKHRIPSYPVSLRNERYVYYQKLCAFYFQTANTPMDIPEFCEMQLYLPKFLLHQRKLSTVASIEESTEDRSSQQSQPTTCLQVPRQTLCVIHLQGREVRVNLYNWSRDDADRLLHRIESLVLRYNQRYQVFYCPVSLNMRLLKSLSSLYILILVVVGLCVSTKDRSIPLPQNAISSPLAETGKST